MVQQTGTHPHCDLSVDQGASAWELSAQICCHLDFLPFGLASEVDLLELSPEGPGLIDRCTDAQMSWYRSVTICNFPGW